MQRLDKTVADCGNMPRSEAVRAIRRGQVTVNGAVCRDPGYKLDLAACALAVAGRALDCAPHRYVMLNKPQGILCVSRDPKERTVVDLLPADLRRRGMFPAGRLDRDTVGLVLLTDDGDFAHRLLSPHAGVFKRYRALLCGALPADAAEHFAAGLTLADGTACLPARLRELPMDELCGGESPADFAAAYGLELSETCTAVEIEIGEGRYHQVKRMCAAVGCPVVWLQRVAIGGLTLDSSLKEGESRAIGEAEIGLLLCHVEKNYAF